MIVHHAGSLFDHPAAMLVNPVNCVGVMGKGVALEFKNRFPGNFTAYANACRAGTLSPGKVLVTRNPDPHAHPAWIANFPTKRHWRDQSRLEDIEAGLLDLVRQVAAHRIESVAMPALGCGLGGLSWQAVHPLIESAFSRPDVVDVEVHVFAPQDTTAKRHGSAGGASAATQDGPQGRPSGDRP